MTAKRLLDVGNCFADHSALTSVVSDHFEVEVIWAHSWAEAQQHLSNGSFDLVLVNRLLDRDGSPGLNVIERIKATDPFSDIPVMMVTNFDQHQASAMEAGAEPGFGKRARHSPETIEKLRAFLG